VNDFLAGVVELSPVVGVGFGVLLGVRLVLFWVVIPLLAIFAPKDQADRAERVLRILRTRPDVQHGRPAPDEPAADTGRHQDET
jgi:hypothetical protein